jgi:molybdenum cofactor guanylyltransferase
MLLDGSGIRSRREGFFEGTRRPARQDSQRWQAALGITRYPERSQGIPWSYRRVMSRDSSTPLRSARNDISAVLLAGGESRRMGRDKATLLFQGKAFWQIQLGTLRKLEPAEIFISARTDPKWRPSDCQFVPDNPPSRGPASGITSSLGQMRTPHLLVLAIDMPFMSEKYLRFLCQKIGPGRGVVPTLNDRFEPLAAIYPREALNAFQRALTGTDFSLQTVAARLVTAGTLKAKAVLTSKQKLFRNINEIGDMQST